VKIFEDIIDNVAKDEVGGTSSSQVVSTQERQMEETDIETYPARIFIALTFRQTKEEFE